VLIGASRPEQVVNNVAALEKLKFSESELATIEQILTEQPAIDWNAGRS
ncbi:L-glyceraldehyde 3-phosphate reductase, partial [Streptococcus thermophilus]|nr:L-glyceraldehyde 3-phosphate reductase [Streptococcus thermophilus]